nr:hypothetical protein Iba_chr13fCG5840 [Ipomoea batatas]
MNSRSAATSGTALERRHWQSGDGGLYIDHSGGDSNGEATLRGELRLWFAAVDPTKPPPSVTTVVIFHLSGHAASHHVMTINGSISGAARGTTRVRATVEASGGSLSVRYKRKVAVKFGDNVPVDDNKQSRALAGFIPVLLPAVQGSSEVGGTPLSVMA